MKTMRSLFLPVIRAQSSGLVVLGGSSFSMNSSTHQAGARVLDPDAQPRRRQEVLDNRYFSARSTMFWIIAPELKSLKYRISLFAASVGDLEEAGSSPRSRSDVSSTAAGIIAATGSPDAAGLVVPGRASACSGRSGVRYLLKMSRHSRRQDARS